MKLSIRFYLDKSKLNKQGVSAIKCRLIYNKSRKEFSSRIFINPRNWNSKHQEVKPLEPNSDYINSQLSLIKTKINKVFKESSFTVNDI